MVSAVITAAGNSIRFGQDKLWVKISGKPVIDWTVERFVKHRLIDEIILVIKKQKWADYERLIRNWQAKVELVEGGKKRLNSVFNGVKLAKGEIVVTHDGSRPLASLQLIAAVIKAAKKFGAAMTAIEPSATVKRVKADWIKQSYLRSESLIAQTPQAFRRDWLLKALAKAIKDKYFVPTDDSELVIRTGKKVRVVPGDKKNIKITHPEDFLVVKYLLTKEGYEDIS